MDHTYKYALPCPPMSLANEFHHICPESQRAHPAGHISIRMIFDPSWTDNANLFYRRPSSWAGTPVFFVLLRASNIDFAAVWVIVEVLSLILRRLLNQLDFVELGPAFAGDEEVVGFGEVGDAV